MKNESRGYDPYMVDEESLEAYRSIVSGQNKGVAERKRLSMKPHSASNGRLSVGVSETDKPARGWKAPN